MPTSATGSKRTAETGFTLIELMVVLVLIGVASAAVVLAIPDPKGRVVDEAERFAVRARAVRDDAIVQGRTIALHIDGNGYAVERRTQGRWQAVGDRAFAPVSWTAGTGVTSPTSRISFDSTGAVADPLTVVLSREGVTARIDIPGDGAAYVAH
jgi:general secretion pathway protein H